VTVSAALHLVSADRGALRGVLDRADDSFAEFGVAPTDRQTTDLSVAEARECADRDPAGPDEWRRALAVETVRAAATDDADRLYHVGVAGMAVFDRLLRETVEGHPAVVLQCDDRRAGVRVGYEVYRYDRLAGEYVHVGGDRSVVDC
jgi:hypothetical protein